MRETTAPDVARGTTPYVVQMILRVNPVRVPDLALWLLRQMMPAR
jgi:hypothetical protein